MTASPQVAPAVFAPPDESQEREDEGPHIVPLLAAEHSRLLAGLAQACRAAQSAERTARLRDVAGAISRHEFAEELVVFPMLSALHARIGLHLDALLAEEQQLKRETARALRVALLWPFSGRSVRRVERLATRHFAHEEEVVLPMLQRQPDAKLRMMGAWFEDAAARLGPTRPHPHAPRHLAGIVATAPVLAVVDRLRDRGRRLL